MKILFSSETADNCLFCSSGLQPIPHQYPQIHPFVQQLWLLKLILATACLPLIPQP
jgi:hypothetical protein